MYLKMANDRTLFTRPKVRFSQIDISETEGWKDSMEMKITAQSDRPKIKSIVTLKKPLKFRDLSKVPNSVKNKDLHVDDNTRETRDLIKPTSSVCDNTAAKLDNKKPINDVSNIENITNNVYDHIPKHSNAVSNDNVNNASLPIRVTEDKIVDEVLKLQTNIGIKESKQCMKTKKENKSSEVQKNLSSNKKYSLACSKTTSHQKHKLGTINSSVKRPNGPGQISADVMTRNIKKKPAVTNVMPCHKYNKVPLQLKTSPVKKTLIRDIKGHKLKPTIGPGFLRQRHDDMNAPKLKESTCVSSNVGSAELKQPKYNSIMCTINKLKEVKDQKVATDINDLPITYKNFVYGKISAALDFPLDEAIYKNLVDLSIDEQQLPSKLMRSKDPEPRQRDIVPVLSDFFKPVSSEEYRTSVSVKPRIPEDTDNWNAFRISDKIFEWKHSMDHA